MESSTPAAPAHEQQEQQQSQPDQKPLGPVALWLLQLLSMVVLVGVVLAFLLLAFALGGNTALTIVLLFVGMVPAVYFATKILAYRRRRSGVDSALATVDEWASSCGLTRTDDPSMTLAVAAAPFDLAGRHTAMRSWTGRYGGQSVAVLHYLVDTGTRKHPERRVYTVVAATGNGDFPLTEAVPQRGAAAVAALVGQDLDVESAEFNSAWRVSSVDERATHSLFTPRVIERMVAEHGHAVRTLWSGEVIVTVQRRAILDTEELTRRLRFVTDLAELVPGFARTDGGFSGAPAATGARAEVTANRKRTRSGTEMVLLVVGLAALWGGAKLWPTVGPVAAGAILLVGLVIAYRSTHIAAWIDRRRGKG